MLPYIAITLTTEKEFYYFRQTFKDAGQIVLSAHGKYQCQTVNIAGCQLCIDENTGTTTTTIYLPHKLTYMQINYSNR